MNPSPPAWSEANQAFLVAEFARLKARLGSKLGDDLQELAPAPPPALEPPAAIDWLTEVFGLSAFERALLLLCAGVEMDSRMATLCGEVQGNTQRASATFGLALAVLPEPHWSALTPSRPLRRFHLLEVDAAHGLASAPLRIDERILHFLAGINMMDPQVRRLARPSPPPQWVSEEHKAVAAEILRVLESRHGSGPIFQLCGDDAQGQEDVAGVVAHQSGRQLFVIRGEEIPPAGPDLERLDSLWQREALMLPAALLVQCGLGTPSASVRPFAEQLPCPLFLANRDPLRLESAHLRFEVNKPPPAEQRALWKKALGPASAQANGTLDSLSTQFRLSAKTIFTTVSLAGGEKAPPEKLWEACRSSTRPRLSDLAQRIIPAAGWEDLVLPETRKETLRHIAAQARHRLQVYDTWGFSAKGRRGLGVSALFSGESGTGKTMAAEVLADELGLDLYRIDLSSVVSKYIGETEKNLKQVFDAAEEGGVLLLFDEADALFGKRSDVKDSHDRYANIEVSYLLQRIEAYEGLAILTTNLKSSMDRAFQRRIRFSVNFPFPDAAQREAIWSRIFPAQTPTRGLEIKRLAQLNVAGGNIRNIALNAAFLAADEGGTPVEMGHLLRAARLEMEKIERPIAGAEIKGWS